MAFWDLDSLRLEAFRPGITSKAEIGNDLIMVCMEIGAGMEDAGHEHPFDQCGIVLQGRIEMFIDSERRILGPNESYFAPVKILDVSLKG
ncbi:MAG: hypothetical protein JRF65_02995 [Deltaproteobacteria bacterium]|nr:hypothetical protein [Deltaproteobacteria bacterium]